MRTGGVGIRQRLAAHIAVGNRGKRVKLIVANLAQLLSAGTERSTAGAKSGITEIGHVTKPAAHFDQPGRHMRIELAGGGVHACKCIMSEKTCVGETVSVTIVLACSIYFCRTIP